VSSTYYRVEAYNIDKGTTTAGFVSAVSAMLAHMLGVNPDIPDEQMAVLVANTADQDVKTVSGLMGILLQGVDYPEVYLLDKKNHYCFFTQDDFSSKAFFFEELAYYVENFYTNIRLMYCMIEFSPEEIVYEDEHQIVVTKESYEAHQPAVYYEFDTDE